MTKLGTKAICKSYLKKLSQRYVVPKLSDEELTKVNKQLLDLYAYGNPIIIENVCEQEKYMIVESEEFEGIIVDKRKIALSRVFECCDDYWTNEVKIRVIDSNKVIDCYKVYYRLGKSRLVPCNMVVIAKENEINYD